MFSLLLHHYCCIALPLPPTCKLAPSHLLSLRVPLLRSQKSKVLVTPVVSRRNMESPSPLFDRRRRCCRMNPTKHSLKRMANKSACWAVGGVLKLNGKNTWKRPARLALFVGLALALGCSSVVRAASAGASHSCVVVEGGSIKVCFEFALTASRAGYMLPAPSAGKYWMYVLFRQMSVCYLPHPASLLRLLQTHSLGVGTGQHFKQCFGENFHGQLGQPDNIVRGYNASDMGDNLPVVPLGVFDAVFVASGSEFNCAIASNGEIKCWGRNEHGQLGLGNNETRGGPDNLDGMGDNLPTVDLGTGLTVAAMALGGSQACAVLTGGGVKASIAALISSE